MAYAPRLDDLYRRAATYVDRVLKGAKPAVSPWSNIKTAKALGLTIPPSVLWRADQIIQ